MFERRYLGSSFLILMRAVSSCATFLLTANGLFEWSHNDYVVDLSRAKKSPGCTIDIQIGAHVVQAF